MTAPPVFSSPELARQNVLTRGQRIRTTLSVLTGLYLLIGLLSLGILGVFWGFSSPFWNELNPDLSSFRSLFGWILGGSFALSAAFFVLYLLALVAARRAIASVQAYALSGEAGRAASDARRFNTWLSVWQWWTVISAAVSIAFVPFLVRSAGGLDPEITRNLGNAELSFVAVSGLIQTLPAVVLTWLVLASVKRFFAAVALHAGGSRPPVTPAASAAGGWLIFTMAVLALGLAFLLPAVIFIAAIGSVPDLARTFEQGASFGVDAAAFRSIFADLAVLLLLSGVLYGLLIALTAWSRGFALSVAALLDAARLSGRSTPPLPMNEAIDPWKTVIALTKPEGWNER